MKCPLLLDANAMISLFEGSDPELERALCSAEELVVPMVAYAEVVAGTEMDTKRAKMTREALLMLLATPNTRLLPVSETTVRHYSKTFNFLVVLVVSALETPGLFVLHGSGVAASALQGRWRPCHIPELGIVAGREKMI